MVVFSVLFAIFNPWVYVPLAADWGELDTLIDITLYITGAVFVAITLFMAWGLIKYTNRPGHKADFEPENKKLELWLTIATGIGVIALLAPGLVIWNKFITVPDDAVVVEVIGEQWTWQFRLPGPDGEFGDVSNMEIYETPFGIDEHDPVGQDDILIEDNELHILVDQPVRMDLRSVDVLHDFYVPNFRAKMDLVPGTVTYFWITPTVPGTYEIVCAELCGLGHSEMRGYVVVDTQADYDEWLAEQSSFAELMAATNTDTGTQAAQLEE